MDDRELWKNLPFDIAKGDLDPRLADWIERVEVHDIVSTEVDSSPDCGTPYPVDDGTGEKGANAYDDACTSEGEVAPPSPVQEWCANQQAAARDGGMSETKEASVQ